MKTELVLIIVSIVTFFVIPPVIYRIVKTYYQRKKEKSYPINTNGYLWNKRKKICYLVPSNVVIVEKKQQLKKVLHYMKYPNCMFKIR